MVVTAASAALVLQDPSTSVAAGRHVAVARYGDVVVTVGGVGRVVPADSAVPPVPADPTGAGSAPSGTASGSSPAPLGAVFPRTSGRVARVFVRTGQRVAAGQVLAQLDDAGVAGNAVQQAQSDVASARVEVRRAQNPLTPADVSALTLEVRRARADLETLRGGTAVEQARALRLARRGATLARRQLRLVLHPRTAADVAAAQADLAAAEAELAALTAPARPPLPSEVTAAQAAVTAAQARLLKLTGPPDLSAVSAARADLARAETELAALLQQNPPPSTAEVGAARAAVDAAAAALSLLLAPADQAELAAAQRDLSDAQAALDALLTPPPPPAPQTVAAARQKVDAAGAKVLNLKRRAPAADVTAARLAVEQADSALRTLRAGPSPVALAAARQAVVSARSRRDHPAGPLDVELARVAVDSALNRLTAARIAEDLLTVRAVTGGTVTTVFGRRGALVDLTTPIVAVNDLDRLGADVDVSEFDAALVRPGMPAELSVDALGGRPFPGTVLSAALTGSDTGGVVTFPVRVGLARDEGVKVGMNVSVRIVVAERRHVVVLPVEAVSPARGGTSQVRVVRSDGSVSRRTVRLGLANNKTVEVVDGLNAGDRVVLPAGGGGGG